MTGADLTASDFSRADLAHAQMTRVNLKESNFFQANLQNAHFAPRLDGLPQLVSLANSHHFATLELDDAGALAFMVKLRSAYGALGLTGMQKTITAMLNYQYMQSDWQSGGWGYVESSVNYLLFYLTSHYGRSPARPLILSLIALRLFTIPYRWVLSSQQNRAGIVVQWRPHWVTHPHKPQHLADQVTLALLLKKRKQQGRLRDELRVWRIAAYFSLLSAFSIGWRDLNIRNWIHRVQRRDYQLDGQGWVRTLAGLQPILTAYLIVLSLLSYFGHPFAW